MHLISALRVTPRVPVAIGTALVLTLGFVGSRITSAGDGFSKQLLAQTIVLLAALVVGFALEDPASTVTQTTSGLITFRWAQLATTALWWVVVPGTSLLLATHTNVLAGDADLFRFTAEGLALMALVWTASSVTSGANGTAIATGTVALIAVTAVIGLRYPSLSFFTPEFVERSRTPGLVFLLIAISTCAITLLSSGRYSGRRHWASFTRLPSIALAVVRSAPLPARTLWLVGTVGVAAASQLSDPGFAYTGARLGLLLTAVALPLAVVEAALPPSPVRVQVLTAVRCAVFTAVTAVVALITFSPYPRLALEAFGMGALGFLVSLKIGHASIANVISLVVAVVVTWSIWQPLGIDTHPESLDWLKGQRAWIVAAAVLMLLGAFWAVNTVPQNVRTTAVPESARSSPRSITR